MNAFYEVINISEDKSKTVGNCSLTFKIRKLKVEDTDILAFDLEFIVYGNLNKIIVYIRRTLKTPVIVEVQSSNELR